MTTAFRFRFGLHFWELPPAEWRNRVRRYEALGYSCITFTDHVVVPQWEPVAATAAVAAVTERIHIGTLVLDNGLRNPVLTAKAAATLERLSGGRLELGLGAGYVAANFAAAGVPFATPGARIDQLAESIALMRHLWQDEQTTFAGRYYQVTDSPRVAPEPVAPTVLVGGGGPHVLRLAGQVADIVSILPRQNTGAWSIAASLADSTLDRLAEKASWVRAAAAAAGRDPAAIELNTLAIGLAIGDDVSERRQALAQANGITTADLNDSSFFLTGSGTEILARLQTYHDRAGISYFSLFDPGEEQVETFATQVIAPLAAANAPRHALGPAAIPEAPRR